MKLSYVTGDMLGAKREFYQQSDLTKEIHSSLF